MKNTTKNFLAVILTIAFSYTLIAQTNVSGGIYTNTTWSLTGSPYIVTSNVVVFPGFVLTIQPGVVVKFDAGTQLEIRQAALVALGTNADSITFTSNASLSAGSWNNIDLNGGTMTSKFNFCNFRYATQGIADNRNGSGDTVCLQSNMDLLLDSVSC
ncbi:MAG TPA: hypothetical protein VNZ49_17370 [Bacteroidia bacterium]|jgi:hypothetical protein|nr:hypothetical protein [Bacteroidia bacterium]